MVLVHRHRTVYRAASATGRSTAFDASSYFSLYVSACFCTCFCSSHRLVRVLHIIRMDNLRSTTHDCGIMKSGLWLSTRI